MKTLITVLIASMLALSAWAAGPVNINTASAEEIADSLNGIGLSKAESIVAYREANGAFLHADELVNVKGVGLKTIDKNKEVIMLKDPEPQTEG